MILAYSYPDAITDSVGLITCAAVIITYLLTRKGK